jgi:taurine dioxygenase
MTLFDLNIAPFEGPLGVAVDGMDLRTPHDGWIRLLQNLLAEHSVLVIRGQSLTDEQFVSFGRAWGPLKRFDYVKQRQHGAVPEIMRISNATSTPPSMRDAALHWHSDNSDGPIPSPATILLGLETPLVGAETLFASTALAYDALSPEMKEKVASLKALHRPGGAPWIEGESPPLAAVAAVKPNAPAVIFPLIMKHPRTGRSWIFVAGTACAIVGWPEEQGRDLIRQLRQHIVQPPFRQQYRLGVGDVLIWDNYAVVHSATPLEHSDEAGKRRLIHRLSIQGVESLPAS